MIECLLVAMDAFAAHHLFSLFCVYWNEASARVEHQNCSYLGDVSEHWHCFALMETTSIECFISFLRE
ncbi:uncharacterized protein A4U43_C03F2210 [Asparagus officinalis]|uniref:Secreted protein n=1 Tax=Asparagus officinalis TaxID=4686 RepID=A0A5P1F7E3_ASPOF|nr:uncharacterized protein A4U43_C03F2210 [Asparagus officinalis]